MTSSNPYAPPKSEVADVVGTEMAPALWNPNAAASWSLLFSPIFGAFLHMRNWQALGQQDKAAQSKNWIVGSIVFFILISLAPFAMPDSKGLDAIGRIGGFALLVSWYYAIGRSQQVYVLGRFGKSYPRRGWAKPLLAALGVVLAFFVVIFVLAFALGAASSVA